MSCIFGFAYFVSFFFFFRTVYLLHLKIEFDDDGDGANPSFTIWKKTKFSHFNSTFKLSRSIYVIYITFQRKKKNVRNKFFLLKTIKIFCATIIIFIKIFLKIFCTKYIRQTFFFFSNKLK